MSVIDARDVELLANAREAGRSGRGRRLRLAVGLSQTETADFCGVAAATISLWESGKRRPTGAAARRYGQLLDLLEKRIGGGP